MPMKQGNVRREDYSYAIRNPVVFRIKSIIGPAVYCFLQWNTFFPFVFSFHVSYGKTRNTSCYLILPMYIFLVQEKLLKVISPIEAFIHSSPLSHCCVYLALQMSLLP